jgi:nitrite reductase/ring-hydroxylating ferredoxin subunit
MKAKAKAVELINKFEKVLTIGKGDMFNESCECALIFVNEMITHTYESDATIAMYNYWLDVRCELNTILLGEGGRILYCEDELHKYHFELNTGEILCCKCELPKRI